VDTPAAVLAGLSLLMLLIQLLHDDPGRPAKIDLIFGQPYSSRRRG